MLRKFFYSRILPKDWIPMRAVMCVMMFTGCWTSYTCRLQMPILAVPMIYDEKKPAEMGGDTETYRRSATWSSPDHPMYEMTGVQAHNRTKRQDDKREETRELFDLTSNRQYHWSPQIRGQLISAYGYGVVPGNLLGGVLAIKYGPRKIIFWSSLIAAFFSLVSPILSNLHWSALLVSRVIIGLMGGFIFPACHTLVAKWAPPEEKARFVWCLLGGTFGTIFTYPMIASMADLMPWEYAWYIPSLLYFFWCLLWFLLAFDSPQEHPGISEEEKKFITDAQAGLGASEKTSLKDTPLKEILMSVPFISLIICHFGNVFLLFFYQTGMTLFMSKALGFNMTKGGILCSLPWAARLLFGFFFSWAGDLVKKKELISLTAFRKTATIFSHLIPGVCLIAVGYLGKDLILVNVFLVLSLGFNGAASIANLSNNQDLSPNYAGFLYGIMNFFGSITSIFCPIMVEEIAGKHGHAIDKWQIIFWIGGIICICSMVVFVIGGSAKQQSWNEGKPAAAKP